MENTNLDTQRCPCCKTCKECPYIQNVVNVKSAGLLIYRYSCVQSTNIYAGKNERSSEIFILHNTKNNDIASEKLIPKLGQYKKCPRCKYILEHAEKILLNIPTINKLDVLGVCDKCRTKDRKAISSCECNEVIEKFIEIKKSNNKEATKGKQKQSKLHKLLNRLTNKDVDSKTSYARTRSESNLDNNICHINSKQKICQPQVDKLIVTQEGLHKTSLIEIQRSRMPISKIGRKIRFTRKNYSDTELVELGADVTYFESNIKYKKSCSDGKVVKESDATHFDFVKSDKESTLRQISVSQDSLFFNFHDLIDKPSHRPKSKLDALRPSTHFQNDPKFDEDKTPSILDLIAAQNRNRKEYLKTDRREILQTETRISTKSDVGSGILKTKLDVTSSPDEAFSTSLLAKTTELLHKDFSYFFLKDELKMKPIQKLKTSSELIKDTQDMLIAREKEIKRKYEEELKRKLDEEENKKKARDEKKPKESKSDKEKDIEKKEIEKSDTENLDLSSPKMVSVEKVSKDVRVMSEKSKKSGTNAELNKTTAVIPKKSQIEKERHGKERHEKERPEKERHEKERHDKERQEKTPNIKAEHERKLSKKDKEIPKTEKRDQSKKEIREKDKNQSTGEKEKKELPEKGKNESVRDNETRENLKAKQSEKESQTREQVKEKIDRNEKLKDSKETVAKSGKEKNVDENLKKPIERRKPEENEIEKNKVNSVENLKAKKEAELKLKALRELDKAGNVQAPPKKPEKTEEPKIKELNINEVKIRRPSHDDLILKLVKLKQAEGEKRTRPRSIAEIHIPLTLIADHKKDHKSIKMATCAICNDSELELDIEEIILNKAKKIEINNVIIGQKIFKYKQPLVGRPDEKQIFPIFMSTFNDDLTNVPEIDVSDIPPEQLARKLPPNSGKYVEPEQPKGVIRYALSDRTFIDKGWTMLPTEKVVRKMNVYRMRPAHPEFDWFEHNKNKKIMHYDTGEKLAEFDDIGRGRLYYRSGRLALDYYNAEEINAQQRFVIHSSGEPDERGCSRPLAILATFDYLGNGIVFDHTGKIRLKYNQTEGVVLDRSIGPVSHWKWHTLNDPPVLQQVMIDTQMAHKDPEILKLGGSTVESKTRPDNEEMLAIEFDNFIKEKSKKLSQKFKPFQIKMKALKINEHFSLRVLDQATIYLIFRDGSTNLKINLGMILDHQEIVDTDTAEVGEVSNSLERFPARTDSLAGLQNSVAFAQKIERARVERERRLRPTQPCSSSDKLVAATSRPLRAPLRTVVSESTVATCRCRKPPINNLYYDTRLL